MTVFDVGANVGDFTAEILRLAPQVSIEAFEPTQPTLGELQTRFAQERRVQIRPFALGAAQGLITMHSADDSSASLAMASAYHRAGVGATGTTQEVLVRTIDEETSGRVDFMKVDVEGHEFAVLSGAQDALASGRLKCIQFEYGGTYRDAGVSIRDVAALLDGHGYRMYRILPFFILRVPVQSIRLRGDTYRFSNWIAQPKA